MRDRDSLPESRREDTESSGVRERGASRRVLVVDDNVDAADMLAEFLTLIGATTRAVYTAREALAETASFAPDLVFLDLCMPDLSGASLARALRGACQAKLVAVTGHDPEVVADDIAAGAFDGCLTKPCSLEALRRILADA